jgi:hypothetical protein
MPPSPTRTPPLKASLLTTSLLALSGCLITEPEALPSRRECEARRAGDLIDCVCDPLTAELVCPDGPLIDGGTPPPSPPLLDMSPPDEAPPDEDIEDIEDMDTGVDTGVIDSDVRDMLTEPDMTPQSSCLSSPLPLPTGCGCDVFTGDIICPGETPFTCDTWTQVYTLDAAPDDLSCLNAPTRVRFDATQELWVGVTRCPSGLERLYLSRDGLNYLPAGDSSGVGQDHCELIQPGFAPLTTDDDITSGGCADCSTTTPINLSGPIFQRARYGERFELIEAVEGSLVARIFCGTPACP